MSDRLISRTLGFESNNEGANPSRSDLFYLYYHFIAVLVLKVSIVKSKSNPLIVSVKQKLNKKSKKNWTHKFSKRKIQLAKKLINKRAWRQIVSIFLLRHHSIPNWYLVHNKKRKKWIIFAIKNQRIKQKFVFKFWIPIFEKIEHKRYLKKLWRTYTKRFNLCYFAQRRFYRKVLVIPYRVASKYHGHLKNFNKKHQFLWYNNRLYSKPHHIKKSIHLFVKENTFFFQPEHFISPKRRKILKDTRKLVIQVNPEKTKEAQGLLSVGGMTKYRKITLKLTKHVRRWWRKAHKQQDVYIAVNRKILVRWLPRSYTFKLKKYLKSLRSLHLNTPKKITWAFLQYKYAQKKRFLFLKQTFIKTGILKSQLELEGKFYKSSINKTPCLINIKSKNRRNISFKSFLPEWRLTKDLNKRQRRLNFKNLYHNSLDNYYKERYAKHRTNYLSPLFSFYQLFIKAFSVQSTKVALIGPVIKQITRNKKRPAWGYIKLKIYRQQFKKFKYYLKNLFKILIKNSLIRRQKVTSELAGFRTMKKFLMLVQHKPHLPFDRYQRRQKNLVLFRNFTVHWRRKLRSRRIWFKVKILFSRLFLWLYQVHDLPFLWSVFRKRILTSGLPEASFLLKKKIKILL